MKYSSNNFIILFEIMNLSIHEIYSTQCLGEASESKASWRRRAKRACFLEAISLASTYD